MNTNKLLAINAYEEAMQWSEQEGEIRLGQKIRVTFTGLKPKIGYAYKEEGAWLGIRYTWKSMRWWSLLNYNNPLIKLEAQEITKEGKPYWVTLWERERAMSGEICLMCSDTLEEESLLCERCEKESEN